MSVELKSDPGFGRTMPSLVSFIAGRIPFYYGWVVIGIAFLSLGLGANIRTAFSLLFPPILKEFGWDRGATASFFSLGFLSAALYAPLIGMALDRYGPQVVLPIGALLVGGGLIMSTWATEVWQFYISLGGLVTGASTLLAYNSHFVFLPAWFERKRGFAIGIACTGVGAISIGLFPWLQSVIETQGWRQGCWILAILIIAVVLPLNLLFQRRRPQDVGLLPDGAPVAVRTDGGTVGTAMPGPSSAHPAHPEDDWTLGRALRSASFWWVAGAFYTALFVWYAILVHQTKYLLDLGYSSTLAAFALGLVPLFGIAGQIGLGALSDRIGREWIWTISCLGFAACYAILIVMETSQSAWLVYVMAAAQGGLGYSLVSVYGAVPADLFQGKRYGTIYGTLAIVGSAGAASGPWALGQIHDLTGSYRNAFWLACALSLLSIAFIWLAGPRRATARRATAALATTAATTHREASKPTSAATPAEPRARRPSASLPAPATFLGATPVVGCSDYYRSRDFYCRGLGYRIVAEAGAPPRFGTLERDRSLIFLDGWQGPRPPIDRLWTVYVLVTGAEQLYADYVARGVPISKKLMPTAHGMLEFEVTDPDGNIICFGEDLS